MSLPQAMPDRRMAWVSAKELDRDEVYSDQLPRIYNYFRFRVGIDADAEDLTARTFESAWRARERYREDLGAFSTWLFTIALKYGAALDNRQISTLTRRRAPSRVRTLIVLLSLGGAAFAVTMAVRGVPQPLLQLFHHPVSPVATERTTLPPFGIGSHQASLARAPSTQASTSAAPLGASASTPAQPGHTAPAAAEPGPWQYFLRRNSAPLLRGWIHPGLPVGWQVQHGVLSKSGLVENLESTREYRDFELQLEWKIGRGGDSGIFYRATHEYPQIYWTGPEYQLLDDYDNVGIPRTEAAGSVYGIYPSPVGVEPPYGYWNSTRIIVRGNNVEYCLNGHHIVSYVLGSNDWVLRVRDSKFASYPDYGLAPEGLIGLQGDNRGSLEVRNMRIRGLP